MTRAQKAAEERVSKQKTRIHKSKQNNDSAINLDALGKLDQTRFALNKKVIDPSTHSDLMNLITSKMAPLQARQEEE